MATLTYTICSEDIANYGTYAALVSKLDDTNGIKRLIVAIDDPLIDTGYLFPSQSSGGYSVG